MSDLITRQAAIDEIMGEYPDAHYPDWYASKIRALPSAQPERKKGKWVQTIKHHKDDEQEYDYIEANCSACGCRRKIGWRGTNFCPMCEADMREGEENEID